MHEFEILVIPSVGVTVPAEWHVLAAREVPMTLTYLYTLYGATGKVSFNEKQFEKRK